MPMLLYLAPRSTLAPSGAQARARGREAFAKLQPCSLSAMPVLTIMRTTSLICLKAGSSWLILAMLISFTRTPIRAMPISRAGVRAILAAGALPVVLGGDHSINIPCVNAFDQHGPVHVVQIDAHLDFVDERHGVRYGHGNPMRRAAEKDYVTGLTQIGIRNVSSTAREGYEDARRMGSDILSVRQFRKHGHDAVLARIPAGARYYLTIDIDAFDPSIAAGTGTPSHGGFLYYEVLEFLDALAQRGTIVGIDLVEVAPDYDLSGSTTTLAAQILMNTIGRILHHRGADPQS